MRLFWKTRGQHPFRRRRVSSSKRPCSQARFGLAEARAEEIRFSLIRRPILNFTVRFIGTSTRSSVFGFWAVLEARVLVSKTPKSRTQPVILTQLSYDLVEKGLKTMRFTDTRSLACVCLCDR